MQVEQFDNIWRQWGPVASTTSAFSQHTKDRARFFSALQRYLNDRGASRILEVGCGTAIDLILLSERVKDLYGIGLDISKEALGVARRHLPSTVTRVGLCRGDLHTLPFPDRSYDLVFSQGVLEHFTDPLGPLREQIRVLERGGVLVVNVPQRLTGYTIHKRRAIRKGTWPWGWETEFSAADLRQMGSGEGLHCLEVFGYHYWRSWAEPSWVLRDLFGKFHRRNPFARFPPFAQLDWLYEKFWNTVEEQYGHLFLQNVVAVFQK